MALLKCFLLIIAILFALSIYAIQYYSEINYETNKTLQKITDIQLLTRLITEMNDDVRNYLDGKNPGNDYGFENDSQKAFEIVLKLYKSNPKNYVYRNLFLMLKSFQTKGNKLFSQSNSNHLEMSYENDAKLIEHITSIVYKEASLAIGNELSTVRKLSESIEEQSNKRSRNVYFITILVTILCIIIAYQISKKITKPIHELSLRCKDVAEGNLSIRVNTIANNDETDILVDSFNDMVERIEDSVFTMQQKVIVEDKLREEQLRNIEMQNLLNQSELKFLRMQINPHFLYNTMNSISALAQIEDAKKTQSMIDSLSSLLRYSLSEISSMVTLADETQITESYLFLQKMRFEDRLNYNINIPEELFSIEMPPMILQPIVENAIIHGIEPNASGGTLSIKAIASSGSINIIISDDGIGMSQNQLDFINTVLDEDSHDSRRGIGMVNVKRRLEMIYGANIMKIESVQYEGTKVTLRIPFQNKV